MSEAILSKVTGGNADDLYPAGTEFEWVPMADDEPLTAGRMYIVENESGTARQCMTYLRDDEQGDGEALFIYGTAPFVGMECTVADDRVVGRVVSMRLA